MQFNFPEDIYGDAKYWLKANFSMKFLMLTFLLLFVPQVLILRGLLIFLSPFEKFNIVIQMKKKLRSLKKARIYFTELI